MCFTNSRIPPSYLLINSFDFAPVLSCRVMQIPLFKKASSLIRFFKIIELNLVVENIFLEG